MTKSFLRIALALVVPAAAAIALTPSGADANVRKVAAGSTTCEFDGYTTEVLHDGVTGIYLRSGEPAPDFNESAGRADCSITRDLPLRTDGFSDIELRFRSYRNYTPRTVMCQIAALRSDGTIVDSEFRSMVVPPFSEDPYVPLSVLDFGNSIGDTHSKGHVVARCFMPWDVALTSVYSSENDGVSNN